MKKVRFIKKYKSDIFKAQKGAVVNVSEKMAEQLESAGEVEIIGKPKKVFSIKKEGE